MTDIEFEIICEGKPAEIGALLHRDRIQEGSFYVDFERLDGFSEPDANPVLLHMSYPIAKDRLKTIEVTVASHPSGGALVRGRLPTTPDAHTTDGAFARACGLLEWQLSYLGLVRNLEKIGALISGDNGSAYVYLC